MAEPARSEGQVNPPQSPVDSLSLGTAVQSQTTLPTPASRRASPPPGAPSIAGYQVLAEIARGGMGCVYAAIELKLDRDVAIKTLLPGRDANRFLTEARITARLPHPSIPPVYELGSLADGAPYLAMKRIHGQTLADLLKQRIDPQAELPKFVQIFEQIAQAVGFAHHRGIIHRDLKPLNVMVGEFGEVQVMDWGLAKELGTSDAETPAVARPAATPASQTTVGNVLGTPGYLAPEQARGEAVDARADVFALGSLLAAILTGQPAVVGTSRDELIERAARAELDEVNARLSASNADAELIALARRCLAARAEDRPANGREVAAEVAVYRASVAARLQQAETDRTRAEMQAAEQLKRRRVLQWAAAAIALVLLIGIAGTGWGLVSARRANALTAKRLQQIERINNSVFDIFTDFDIREIKEKNIPLEAALAEKLVEAGHQLDGQMIEDPLVLAALQYRLGRTLLNLGLNEDAIQFLTQARNTRLKLLGANHPDSLASLNILSAALMEAGQFDLALPLLEETLQLMKVNNGPDDPNTLVSQGNLAKVYRLRGEFDRALPLLEDTRRRMTDVMGPDHPFTHTSMSNLANVYLETRQLDLALPLLEETLQRREASLGADHPDTINSQINLGLGYQYAGQLDKALPLLASALQRSQARQGPQHPDTLNAMNNLASGYYIAGKIDEALVLFEEMLQLSKVNPGPDHPDTLTAMDNLFSVYMDARKVELAVPLAEETLLRREKVLPAGHPDILTSRHNLGMGYLSAGQFEKALPILEESLRDTESKFGPEHINTLTSRRSLAKAYCQAGQGKQAEELFRVCIEASRQQLPAECLQLADILGSSAEDLLTAHRYNAAEKYLREGLAFRKQHEPDAWPTFHTQSLLGEALRGQDQLTAAEPLLVQGYEGLKAREEMLTAAEAQAAIPPALDRLIALYKQLNDSAKVAEYESLRSQYTVK